MIPERDDDDDEKKKNDVEKASSDDGDGKKNVSSSSAMGSRKSSALDELNQDGYFGSADGNWIDDDAAPLVLMQKSHHAMDAPTLKEDMRVMADVRTEDRRLRGGRGNTRGVDCDRVHGNERAEVTE